MYKILFYIFMTYTKEKSKEIMASSVNFESFSENFTLYSKYQCCKNFYLQSVIFQKMSHETHPQRKVLVNVSYNLYKSFNQFLLFHISMRVRQRFFIKAISIYV